MYESFIEILCTKGKSRNLGYQLTISFIWVTPLKQKSVLFHHMLASVSVWKQFHQPI